MVVRVRRLHVIAVRHVREGSAVQLAIGVIFVGRQGDPAVLVEVEGALAVDVTLARLQGRLDDPDPVQLPTHQVGVDVVRRGDVGRLLVVVQLVGVVRNIHFLLANQFEIKAVHGTGEDPGIVIGRAAGRTRVRCVIGNVRRQLHPALSG
ncbi:hypothetical protein D3C85_1420390 [compost metagenome]